jgi:cellulose synthase/poly-beta-1,6-N-acetylglucosamine synthase-like glycosyltransferase
VLKCIALLKKTGISPTRDFTPSVSILLSVYNEENIIKEKIQNFLSLDYPRELLEMVIVSDKCTDKTEEIIRSFHYDNLGKSPKTPSPLTGEGWGEGEYNWISDTYTPSPSSPYAPAHLRPARGISTFHESINCERIKLLIQENRSGKTMALNRGVTEAKGDILIFTDANSMFDKDAVRRLVGRFADPAIGLVSGRSVYLNSLNQNEELGGAYRKYEEMIKEDESKIASIVGADGAIYAMRKSLYDPLPPEYINDLIHPIQVVLNGYRAVSEPQAVCREVIDETHCDELRRQTRIMAQSWLIFCTQIGKLLRKMKLVYAWELLSHKFLRWLTIPVMIVLFVTTAFMISNSSFYQMIFFSQLVFLSLVLFGGRSNKGFVRLPYMFTLLHLASVLGFFKYLTGNIYTTWSPRDN